MEEKNVFNQEENTQVIIEPEFKKDIHRLYLLYINKCILATKIFHSNLFSVAFD